MPYAKTASLRLTDPQRSSINGLTFCQICMNSDTRIPYERFPIIWVPWTWGQWPLHYTKGRQSNFADYVRLRQIFSILDSVITNLYSPTRLSRISPLIEHTLRRNTREIQSKLLTVILDSEWNSIKPIYTQRCWMRQVRDTHRRNGRTLLMGVTTVTFTRAPWNCMTFWE